MNVTHAAHPAVSTKTLPPIDHQGQSELVDDERHVFAEQLQAQIGEDKAPRVESQSNDEPVPVAEADRAVKHQDEPEQGEIKTAKSADQTALTAVDEALLAAESEMPINESKSSSHVNDAGEGAKPEWSQTMQHGADLLGRLQQADASLRSREGNNLPPDNASPTHHGDVADESVQANMAFTGQALSMIDKDESTSGASIDWSAQDVPVVSHSHLSPIDHAALDAMSEVELNVDASIAPLLTQSEFTQGAHLASVASAEALAVDVDPDTFVDWHNNLDAVEELTEAQLTAALVAASNTQDPAMVALREQRMLDASQSEPTLSATGTSRVEGVTHAALAAIDTKLAQGIPLTQPEQQILADLQQGRIVVQAAPDMVESFTGGTGQASLAESKTVIEWRNLHAETSEVSNKTLAGQNSASQTQPGQLNLTNASQSATALQTPALNSGAEREAALAALNANLAAEVTSRTTTANAMIDKEQLSHMIRQGRLQAAAGASREDTTPLAAGDTANPYSASGSQTLGSQFASRLESMMPSSPAMSLSREMAAEQMSEKIQMMMSKNLKSLDIRLDPPELGRLQIRLNLNNDAANVHFTVSNPQAREMIEHTLPRLREMLAQQGMQMAESSVQQQASGQGGQQFARSAQGELGTGSGEFARHGDSAEPEVEMTLNVPSGKDGISFYA